MGPEPFGSWPSPLSAAAAAGVRAQRSGLASDGTFLYWLESRPSEGGRVALQRAVPGGVPEEVSPSGANVRSRVHEYGGGAFCVVPTGDDRPSLVAYVEAGDQRVYEAVPGADATPPRPLTHPAPPGERWNHGDLHATPGGRHVLAVREQIAGDVVRRSIVALAARGLPALFTLVEGPDFVAAPRVDREGRRLAWVSWEHPDMSWTSSTLWVADLLDGPHGLRTGSPRLVAGGPGVSVGQPVWAADGSLFFVCDSGGWWQPWMWRAGGDARCLSDEPAEFHTPDWALGQCSMVPTDDGRLVCRTRSPGADRLGVLALDTGTLSVLEQPAVSVGALCSHGRGLAWSGSTPFSAGSIWWVPEIEFEWRRPAEPPPSPRLAAAPLPSPLEPADVSVAQPFSLVNRDGDLVYGLFYPPKLRGTQGIRGERPPLVVHCHGGPTGSAEPGFDVVVQFLTTRGLAVAAVDYGGSAGHGRAYRDRLAGRWGVLDVDDCVDAAVHLAQAGLVDEERMAIRGSSAGGFTALLALARARKFRAVVSWYGVTDLRALAASTHDFESHYTDWLIGPLPEAGARYEERSPRFAVDRMAGSVLLLQGLDDLVVPPEQAEAMAGALRSRGVRCELLTFAGEGHGFRRADTVARCLEVEHSFYAEVLLGPPA